MKQPVRVLMLVLIVAFYQCTTETDSGKLLSDIRQKIESGNLTEAKHLAACIKKNSLAGQSSYREADSLSQIAERIGIDFPVTEKEIKRQIKERTGNYSRSGKEEWEKKGWLEYRILNGHKMYFKRAVSNLILLMKFYGNRDTSETTMESNREMTFRKKHTSEILTASEEQNFPVMQVRMKITYTLTVHPDVVPAGDTIRCWLPWPLRGNIRQNMISLISTNCSEHIFSPDTAVHSTIYMEKLSEKGKPTVFQISYTYRSSGQHFRLSECKILPYDKGSGVFRKYTSEQLPHICFTPEVRHLADSITGNEKEPSAIVRKIYMWFKEYIPWTGALEYSVMPDIPAYVIKNRRGDCGMQTFLFISMLRYKGIPVRWQSGWMVPPEAENLHDWCEVYYEGTGWVPADVSYDLQQSDNPEIREFYLSGIDSYRLILNDGIAGQLFPAKRFLRSEPYDFQRGEVEWKGGNLYFDKWDYDMKIEYPK